MPYLEVYICICICIYIQYFPESHLSFYTTAVKVTEQTTEELATYWLNMSKTVRPQIIFIFLALRLVSVFQSTAV